MLSSLHALAAASVTPLLSSGMRQNGSLSLRAVLGGVVAVAAAVAAIVMVKYS